MSADLLRRAAALMRERAHSAFMTWRSDVEGGWFQGLFEESATHAQAMTPTVGLDVADWLDDSARKWEINFRATQSPSPGDDVPPGLHFGNPGGAAESADHHARHALAVARAYLGEPS